MMKIFMTSLLFISILFQSTINAQWLKINTPLGKYLKFITVAEKKIIMVSSSIKDSVFLSSNDGESWLQINNGIKSQHINSLSSSNNFLFISSDSGVYRSRKDIISWELINDGLPDTKYIYSITVIEPLLFAITAHQKLYKSTNYGTNWIPTSFNSSAYCLTSNGKELFAGSYGLYIASCHGIFISPDSGITWKTINSGLPGTYVRAVAYDGSKLFSGIYSYVTETTSGANVKGEGVFSSTNKGTSWEPTNAGLTNTSIKSFWVAGSNLFATTASGGLYFYKNISDLWVSINSGLPYSPEYSIAGDDTDLYAIINDMGIWKRSLVEITTRLLPTNKELPNNFFLSQNYPNPFNPETTISYSIPKSEHVTLKIYDLLGREVATLVDEYKNPGSYHPTFNTLRSLQEYIFTDCKRDHLVKQRNLC